jgi:hypothetical protein
MTAIEDNSPLVIQTGLTVFVERCFMIGVPCFAKFGLLQVVSESIPEYRETCIVHRGVKGLKSNDCVLVVS